MNEQLAETQSAPTPPLRVVRFGLFEVDLRAWDLRKQGRRIKVQTQPFQVLAVLLERPGEIVTRDELCRRLWPEDTFVDFDHSLNTAIRRLRKALADSPENPIFIETLQRRGYRFIAPVVFSDSQLAEAPRHVVAPSAGHLELPPSTEAVDVLVPRRAEAGARMAVRSRRNFAFIGIAGLTVGALLAASGAYVAYQAREPAARAKLGPVRSLAVLPLENLSVTPEQEYLADGMTDELIASLAKVKSLRVVPRTSSMAYKGAHKSLSVIAKELNVDAVVEGTVMRSGSRIRITTQLVQIATDRALRAETYESSVDDVLSVQQRVAGAIVSNIQLDLTPEERQNLWEAIYECCTRYAVRSTFRRFQVPLYNRIPPEESTPTAINSIRFLYDSIFIMMHPLNCPKKRRKSTASRPFTLRNRPPVPYSI